MEQLQTISPGQYEVLNMLSCIHKEDDVKALKDTLVQFLNARLQNEIERLWDNEVLTKEKVDSWNNEHMRTPYKAAHL